MNDDPDTIVAKAEMLSRRIGQARDAVAQVILGQQDVIDQSLITLLSGGHVLLIGVPGLAQDPAGGDAGHRPGHGRPSASSSRPT